MIDQQSLEVGKFVVEVLKILVLPIVYAMTRKLDGLARGQQEIKNAITEINAWRQGHDKQDDERHDTVAGEVNSLRVLVTGGRLGKICLVAVFVIAAAAASAWGQTATPTLTNTPTPTATPCKRVEIESISLPPLLRPLEVRGSQDAIIVAPALSAGVAAPLTVRFSNRRCISRGGDGDREGQSCDNDADCPTLGVTVPYTCTRRLDAPETIDYSVIDVATGEVVTALTAVTAADRALIILDGAETRPLNDPPVDARFRRRVRLAWSYPCGDSARDIDLTFRVVHASTPTPTLTQTPTSTPTL